MSANHMQKILDYLNTPEGKEQIPRLQKIYFDILNEKETLYYSEANLSTKLFNTDINKKHIFSVEHKSDHRDYYHLGSIEIHPVSIDGDFVNIEKDLEEDIQAA